jgi:ketosteroid isomerase-like protein
MAQQLQVNPVLSLITQRGEALAMGTVSVVKSRSRTAALVLALDRVAPATATRALARANTFVEDMGVLHPVRDLVRNRVRGDKHAAATAPRQPTASMRTRRQIVSEQANINIVQQIYADFGQGKVQAILERMNPDVDWVNAGPLAVPYARGRRGLGEVSEFFSTLAATVDVQSFEPREFFASGDRVVVLGAWSGRAKTTGKPFASDWAMAWTVKAGKVTSFRSYEDTHLVAAAFGA